MSVFALGGLLFLPSIGVYPLETASAQDPPELPEIPEVGRDAGVFIVGMQDRSRVTLPEGGVATFPVRFVDISVEAAEGYTSAIPIRCEVTNSTTDQQPEGFRGWSHSFPLIGSIQRNTEKEREVTIQAGMGASPRYYHLDVVCTAGPPVDKVVGVFNFTAKLETYQRFTLQPQVTDRVGPDQEVSVSVTITNIGNDVERYVGRVEAPPGFVFEEPPMVLVGPGETKEVDIRGFTSRDKIWYRSQMMPVKVTYGPESGLAQEQTRMIGVPMGGLYMHPALVPLILLSLIALVVFAMILVYARRTVEEQVFGKPVPPWRIPVEREYLKRLEQEDPDEFYVVRYHLMVEEHQSAMLWYRHFKHVTRKDRKRERKWLKASQKVKKGTARIRAGQERLEHRMARRLRVLPVRRRRRLKALERRLLKRQWREQGRLLHIHKRGVSKITKVHAQREKKAKKAADAEFQKEYKRAEKENKKRIKAGEEPTPLLQEPKWDYPEPELPQPVEVPLVKVQESVLAVRAERMSRGFNRKIARRSAKAKKKMRRKGAKRDKKADQLKRKIPKPPSTHLFEEDEYLDPEDVVVEDSRTTLQRALRIPAIENRETLRRRRMVYKVRIRQAKHAKDMDRVEHLKREYARERRQILQQEERSRPNDRHEQPEAADRGSADAGAENRSGLSLLRRRRGGPETSQGDKEATHARTEASKGKSSVTGEDGP